MLQIGLRSFDLVRAQSGFFLSLGKREYQPSLQNWRFEAHYVPSDHDLSPREDGQWEYLRLTIFPHEYDLRDWRELSGFGLAPAPDDDTADSTWLGSADVTNLLAPLTHKESHMIYPGDFLVRRSDDYLFSCEFSGTVKYPDREEELHLADEIAFAGILLRVPMNAADPVANAHARVTREIGPIEIADGRVTPFDWRREKDPDGLLDDSHLVFLTTAWRKNLA